MHNHFSNEVDGQLKFYQDYLPLVDNTLHRWYCKWKSD